MLRLGRRLVIVVSSPLLIHVLLAVDEALETVVLLDHLLNFAYLIYVVSIFLIVKFIVDQSTEYVSKLLVKVGGLLLEIGDHTNRLLALRRGGILRPKLELSSENSDGLVDWLVGLQVADFLD